MMITITTLFSSTTTGVLIVSLFITLVIITAYYVIIARTTNNNNKKRYHLPPGPVLNCVPFVGYLPFMTKDPHVHLCELARKYGDAMSLRFGSYDIVVLNNLQVIRSHFKEPVFSGRPNHLLAMEVSKQGVTFATGQEANDQRRFVLKTLRDLGFGKSSMEALILEEVKGLVGYFKTFPSGSVHQLTYLFGLSVINALWSVLASRKFKITDLVARKAYQMCIEGFIDPPVSGILWFLPTIAKAFPQASGYNSVVMAVKELRALVSEVVDSHKMEYERKREVVDFVDAYIQRIEEETDVTSSFYGDRGFNNLVHVLIDLFTAGSDTLNSSLNFAIKYLCENPQIQENVHKELDKVLSTKQQHSRYVEYEDRKNLPLLDAVITETLRISSIVTGGILHSTTSDADLVTAQGTYKLPSNTIVMANLYWVHHNPQYWGDDHDKFDPTRFLGEKQQQGSNTTNKSDVIAFSTGRRVCIAEQMAQVEFFLFLGGLLANFEFEGVGGDETGRFFGGVKPGLVLNVEGLEVRVKERCF